MSPCRCYSFRVSVCSPLMNMSNQMYRLSSTYLLIFCCFTFVCIHGRGQDPPTSCDIEVMVRWGMTWKAAPHERLTVECPVKHCGESLNVTWCKLLDTSECEQINYTANVEIREKRNGAKLTSFLTFKRISIDDDGQYRCGLKDSTYQIGHTINISVSELYEGVHSSGNYPDELPSVAADWDLFWLPYFAICVGVSFLITTLTVTTLSFHGWKRTLTFNHTKGQEMSTRVIPGLPRDNAPSTPVLQAHLSIQNDIFSPSTAEKLPSHPPPITNRNQSAVAKTADAVYAVINHHQQSGIPAREQHTAAKQDKKVEYTVITVS